MAGALLSVAVESILVVLAVVLACAALLRDLLWWCGAFGFRCGIAGGPSDVTADGKPHDYPARVEELTRLGFMPAGVYWEKAAFTPRFREDIFLHPESDIFAVVYSLFGRDLHVMFMTRFASGALVKTCDTPGDTYDEPDYRVNRLPSEPLAELLIEHRRAVSQLVESGSTVVPANSLDAVHDAQQHAFRHAVPWNELRATGRQLLLAKLGLMGTVVVPVTVLSVFLHGHPVIRSMLMLGAAGWVILISLMFLCMGWMIRLVGSADKSAEPAPEPDDSQLATMLLARLVFVAAPVIGLLAVNWGVDQVALATVGVVLTVAGFDLLRVFVRSCRTPLAVAHDQAEHS